MMSFGGCGGGKRHFEIGKFAASVLEGRARKARVVGAGRVSIRVPRLASIAGESSQAEKLINLATSEIFNRVVVLLAQLVTFQTRVRVT